MWDPKGCELVGKCINSRVPAMKCKNKK
ncbi:unnamed protein product [Spirodela intermedia]|uniref:Uncharacterized protein n=1 Tax=Spirodela intermedia TaxID=51605 RepID=A0A7I8KUQ6_SPIIN|nr:unnamed protein product [Spirodela intermedia]